MFRIVNYYRAVGLALPFALITSATVAVGLHASRVEAQPARMTNLAPAIRIDEPVSATQAQIERAKAQLQQSQWSDAVDTLRQILQEDDDRLVRASDEFYVPLHEYCHHLIAALPLETLALYRQQVDGVAADWLQNAITSRDEPRLSQIIDEFFCSSSGDEALNIAAEMAVERRDYSRARDCWERISPQLRQSSGAPLWLVARDENLNRDWPRIKGLLETQQVASRLAYPDTNLDLAEIRAKLVMVSILEGSLDRAAVEFALFKRLHPQAEGRFAGRDTLLAPALESLMKEAGKPVTKVHEARAWLTFAGAPARTEDPAGPLDIAGPAWREPIRWNGLIQASSELSHRIGLPRTRVAEEATALLAYHPVVTNDLLLIANDRQVAAYDARTGRPAFLPDTPVIYPASDIAEPFQSNIKLTSTLGAPRFTMTVHGSLLYARLGSPVTAHADLGDSSVDRPGHIVCLDLARQGQLKQVIKSDGPRWSFEGAPLAAEGYLYVAMRYSDVRPQVHVACYETSSGRLMWRRFVCAGESTGSGVVSEATHNLLTLDGDRLYLNTNLGAVAALHKKDGQLLWIHTYKRSSPSKDALHYFRDLNPCLYYRDMIFVAPTDSEDIFALSASSGTLLWKSYLADDVVHLLGVGNGHLIASGNRLWWFDIHSGKAVTRFPGHPSPATKGHGRGTLAGNLVYWPTRSEIHVFGQRPKRDGTIAIPARQPISLEQRGIDSKSGSNLVACGDQLLVVTANSIMALSGEGSSPGVARNVTRSHSREAAGDTEMLLLGTRTANQLGDTLNAAR